ncbi:MAG: ribbon-helix-helix domain-containing protein [Candidatus Limnocylindrales bacterium]
MKVRVSVPAADVAFLDAYATTHRLASRSAAIREAVRVLRTMEIAASYESAWDEEVAPGPSRGLSPDPYPARS